MDQRCKITDEMVSQYSCNFICFFNVLILFIHLLFIVIVIASCAQRSPMEPLPRNQTQVVIMVKTRIMMKKTKTKTKNHAMLLEESVGPQGFLVLVPLACLRHLFGPRAVNAMLREVCHR